MVKIAQSYLPRPGRDRVLFFMPSTKLSDLLPRYSNLWDTCSIRPEFQARVQTVCDRIFESEDKYRKVAKILGWEESWWFIGCLHNMESGCCFDGHLHNGDPLKNRTIRVPTNRPVEPPINGWSKGYSWEESAIDALRLKDFENLYDRSIPAWLWRAELYNGFGYQLYHPEVNTPYLWSGTNHYTKGKYTKDGKYDPNAVSAQVGVAAIMKMLLYRLNQSKVTAITAKIDKQAFVEIIGDAELGFTWAKRSAKQNVLLSESEKSKLTVGTRLRCLSIQEEDGHYVVQLPLLLVSEDGNYQGDTWYVFKGHTQLEDISKSVEMSLPVVEPRKPKTFPEKIVALCEKRKYPLDRTVSAVNIIGLEGINPDGTSNSDAGDKWNDSIGLLCFDANGQPFFKCLFRGTTEPGRYFTVVRLLNPNGAAKMQVGYHPGIWQIGIHKGYQALVQAGNPIRLIRDRNRNFLRDDKETVETWKGVNLHHGNNAPLSSIGRWSAGCTVIRVKQEFETFLHHVKNSSQYKRNKAHKFDYILIWRDWLKEVA